MTFPVLAMHLSRLAFALACAIGLVGAWIGLAYHSFWFDELYAAVTVGDASDFRAMLSRISEDVTPPLYYALVFGFAQIFGMSDAAMRGFSAFFACLSIVVFFLGTRQDFSRSARLFACAMATGSHFWFFQAQSARYYTLCLALSALILLLALSVLRQPRHVSQRGTLAALAITVLLGGLVHFYVTIEGLAVLLVLFLYRPRERLLLGMLAGLFVASTLLYLQLVVWRHAQVDSNNFYIPRSLSWYPYQLRGAFHYALGKWGALAAALCLAGIVAGYFQTKDRAISMRAVAANLPHAMARDGTSLLFLGVPLLVLAGGVASSLLLSPNFTDRNLLICSPFLWGVWARLYDWAKQSIGSTSRILLDLGLSLVTLWTASIALQRTAPKASPYLWTEPFRQSAEWIAGVPSCRDAIIPVVDTDRKAWYRGDYADRLYAAIYGRYLAGYARPRIMYRDDIDAHRLAPGMAAEIRDRLDGKGCPVIAWGAHNVAPDDPDKIRLSLLAALGRQGSPDDLMTTHVFRDGRVGYVFEVRKEAR